MANSFQDIIPPDKRSIRNIPIPSKPARRKIFAKKLKAEEKSTASDKEAEILKKERDEALKLQNKYEKNLDFDKFENPSTRGVPRFFLWGITACVVLILFFAVTSVFKTASVSIVERSTSVPLSGNSSFYLNPNLGEAGYSTITISDSITANVPASGSRQVSTNAKGSIIIYNNFNTSGQKLVSGTRFETPSGLIFKLDKSVTVPGFTKSKGKTIPGSIVASVTAEKPGSNYNIDLSDFTIPGFKGDPKYSGFYARSKTPMTGGSTGSVAVVDDTTLKAIVTNLENQLTTSLKQKATKQLPESQLTFDGFSSISFSVADPVSIAGDAGKATVKVSGTAKFYAIDIQSFAKSIMKASPAEKSNVNYSIDFSNAKVAFVSEASSTMQVKIDGSVKVISDLDKDAYLKAISGKSVKEIPVISSTFPEISKASVVIKPFSFFGGAIPADISKISLQISN